MPANSTIKTQSPDEEQQDLYKNYALSGRLILASVISILVILVIFLILHFYARWYLARLHRRQHTRRRRNRQNRRNNRPFASSTGGLEPSVLNSLPLFVYSSERVTKMEECAVCLSEFENGENGRVLPNCKHSFHTECIDMWFYSHSTCPLCRSPVEPVETEMTTLDEPGSGESLSSPVQPAEEVMETTTDDDRRKPIDVRIEVPDRNESVAESEFRLPSASQEFWSPGSRLASLKRIMNMSRRSPVESPSSGVGPSCAPVDTELDIESGIEEVVQESSRAGATESDQTRGAMSGGIYDQ